MTYGVTPQGFIPKPLQVIKSEIEADQLALIDPTFDNSPETIDGQNNGIFANQLAACWEAVATLDSQMDPDKAEDAILDGISALTGAKRKGELKSTVPVACSLGAFTSLPVGVIVGDPDFPTHKWLLRAAIENNTAAPAIVNGVFEAENAGPIEMLPHATAPGLDILTPITGWTLATNANDATPGAGVETNTQLRIRREQELAIPGSATERAVYSDILAGLDALNVSDNRSVRVLVNETDAIDGNGLPPHSIEAIVYDGTSGGSAVTNDQIAQMVFESKAGGINTYGNTSGTAIDISGTARTIRFSRPVVKPVYIDLDITITSSIFPTGGDTLIKKAIADHARDTLIPGVNVIALGLRAQALTVLGVTDCPTFRLDFSASPTATINLPVGLRELATVDTSNITVNHV